MKGAAFCLAAAWVHSIYYLLAAKAKTHAAEAFTRCTYASAT